MCPEARAAVGRFSYGCRWGRTYLSFEVVGGRGGECCMRSSIIDHSITVDTHNTA